MSASMGKSTCPPGTPDCGGRFDSCSGVNNRFGYCPDFSCGRVMCTSCYSCYPFSHFSALHLNHLQNLAVPCGTICDFCQVSALVSVMSSNFLCHAQQCPPCCTLSPSSSQDRARAPCSPDNLHYTNTLENWLEAIIFLITTYCALVIYVRVSTCMSVSRMPTDTNTPSAVLPHTWLSAEFL